MATAADIPQVLASTLNPDSNIRIAAELNLSELLKDPRKPRFFFLIVFVLIHGNKGRHSHLHNSCSLRTQSPPLYDR